jgi:hypothetical protein
MELEEYLERLKICPDERLTGELGIYDNWSIFLNLDFQRALKHFYESPEFKFYELQGGDIHRFDFVPGTVKLQVFNWLAGCGLTQINKDNLEESTFHQNRQKRDYNMTIMLHPYQKKKIEGIDLRRALVMVVENLSEWVVSENIPLCFPDSIGRDYKKPRDYSRIVYFP